MFTMFIPLKINMYPKHHPIEQENHLPNLHFWVPAIKFPGCEKTHWPWPFPFPFISLPFPFPASRTRLGERGRDDMTR